MWVTFCYVLDLLAKKLFFFFVWILDTEKKTINLRRKRGKKKNGCR